MREGRGGVRRPQLTERDRQLFGYLGICRYLSTEQVLRLFFPARDRASSQRRLLRLAGEWGRLRGDGKDGAYANFDPPYLRRLFFRTYEGDRVEVWALTEVGYAVAGKVLKVPVKVPAQDVGANFLEHSVLLNEVFVSLVDPAAVACARCRARVEWAAPVAGPKVVAFVLRCSSPTCAAISKARLADASELPFRWTGPEGARLPWKDYDRRVGATRDRVIVPDAVLEILATKTRYFLEFETGTQSVVAPVDKKPGATVAKLERYADFLSGLADPNKGLTNYRAIYPDDWTPSVIFIAVGEARRESIQQAIHLAEKKLGRISAKALLGTEVAELVRTGRGREASPTHVEPERVRPGRLSVRAEFLVDVAACLRDVAKLQGAGDRVRDVLRVAEVYAQRAHSVRPDLG